MAERGPHFRVPVWTYTYASEQFAGDILLYSPQRESQEGQPLLLRQINSSSEGKSWIDRHPAKFKRWSKDENEQKFDDVHGVILKDGLSKPLGQENDENAPTVRYSRGHRIWVEWTHDPRREIGDEIPVLNLDTKEAFIMPLKFICFIPRIDKTSDHFDENEVSYLALPVGPVIEYFPRKKNVTQLFFVWPADDPHELTSVWDTWERTRGRARCPQKFQDYKSLDEEHREGERKQIFDIQWVKLSKKLGILRPHHVPGRDMSPPPRNTAQNPIEVEDSDTSSNPSLDTHWAPGAITMENCCNLAPRCRLALEKGVDLASSYVGGAREVEHYHVQDEDVDECPEGSRHQGHCVLRNDRTRCVFSRDTVDHTCCKLRTNPVLPGPHQSPDNDRFMLWETTAGDEEFYDLSKNVRVRSELKDRDRVPPQLQRLQEERDRERDRALMEETRQKQREELRQRHMGQSQQMAPPSGPPYISESGVQLSLETAAGPSGYQSESLQNQGYQDDHRGKNKSPATNPFSRPPNYQAMGRPTIDNRPRVRATASYKAKQPATPVMGQDMQPLPASSSQPMAYPLVRDPGPSNQGFMGQVAPQPGASPGMQHMASPSGAPYIISSPVGQPGSHPLEAIPEHQPYDMAPSPRHCYQQPPYPSTGKRKADSDDAVPRTAADQPSPQGISGLQLLPPLVSQGRESSAPALPSPGIYGWSGQSSLSPRDSSVSFPQAVYEAAASFLPPLVNHNSGYMAPPSPSSLLPPFNPFSP